MADKKKKVKSDKLRTTMYLCDQCYPKRVWDVESFDAEVPHACAACGNTHLTPIIYSVISIEYDPNTEDQKP